VENVAPILLLLAVFAVLWLFMIQPARRRQRAAQHLQGALALGDEIMTTAGMFGVVASLDEETVQLEVADGVTVKIVRAAVGRVVTPASRDEEAELAATPADEPEENQSDGTQ
jgi:preprotein translocase subunit YajC